jgi:S1-C subfamily serine protease
MTRATTRWIGLLWVASLLLLGTTVVQAQTAQEIAKRAFGSTVLLVMEDTNGQPLSLGSGFFVRDGEVATNLHVVEGAARGYAKIIGQRAKYDIDGIIAVDPERDLVVLKISGARAAALTLGNSESVQVGEIVYAVGNPQGLEGTFSQGIVSSIREVGADKLLQITAPISPGSSGGPVLSGKGEVVGVSVATFRGGQNLNFAIPSIYLKQLLTKSGPAKPLTQVKSVKAQKSILADLGGRSSDGVVGVQLTWDLPGNQFSGRYSFSFRNKLRDDVKNVYCLVVFKDSKGGPIEIDVVGYDGVIPAGLAKRVHSEVDGSIGVLTKWKASAVELRILDFELAN